MKAVRPMMTMNAIEVRKETAEILFLIDGAAAIEPIMDTEKMLRP